MFGLSLAFFALSTLTLGIRFVFKIKYIKNFLSMINSLILMITINTDYNRKLINLVKIDIDKIKYNGQNNNLLFKLAKL